MSHQLTPLDFAQIWQAHTCQNMQYRYADDEIAFWSQNAVGYDRKW